MENTNQGIQLDLQDCPLRPSSSSNSIHSRRSKGERKYTKTDLENNEGNGLQRNVSKYIRRHNFIKEILLDYTTNSNLHGVKYIGDKDRTIVEKIFWLFLFICCLVLCSGLIWNLWIKWNENPVIVNVAENPKPVWQIPYPAVTICFETKAMQRKFNFTNYYHLYYDSETNANLTDEKRNLFEDVSMVCDDHLAPPEGRKFSSGLDTVNNIKEVSPNMTDVFFGCKWKDTVVQDCSSLFSPVLTEEGVCFTFNTLGAEELLRVQNLHNEYPYLEHDNEARAWSLEDGYRKSEPIETYPHRGSGYGVKSGLTFLLKTYGADLDYLCKGPVQGFKILLHNPAELPRVSQQYFRSPLSQEVVVAVKPTMMTTSEELRPYDPLRRQCFFPTERYLRYFKVYTQANCEMECLANFTYTRCGCVHFGMPRGPGMNVCNAGSMECIKNSQMELVTIAIQSDLGRATEDVNDKLSEAREVASQCQCLPSCTSIEYEAETSQADYDWRAIYRAFRLDVPEEDLADELFYSRVMIFFKEAQFTTTRRSELYGKTDFLANCGGLLGLFMGFSVLSVAEIVYFFTLRSESAERHSENDLEKKGGLQRNPSRYERRRNFVKEYLIDYTANSNLHGLKYIGEKERTYVEKVFWLFMFICCVVLCSGLIRKVWNKWNENPVIVSFAENTTPVWQIPYPAVSVCFETKAMQRKFNFTDYYHLYYNNETYGNLTEEERHLFEDVSMVCDDHLAPPTGRKFSSGLDTVNNIKEVSPNFTEVFFGCKWKDIPSQNCTELFSPILTEEGLCYTFNTLGAEELFRVDNLHKEYPYLEHHRKVQSWSLEGGYGKSEPIETYPHRGSGYGVKSGLTFLLKAYGPDLDYLCKGPVQGFKILLHNPAELPRLSQQYFRSPLSQEIVVAVKPTMMTTSEGLGPYDPLRRQCFFPTERYLRYFKVYTQANCEMECLANFTYTRCGCVHFGMPRGPGMNVCNAGSMACIKTSQMDLVTIEIQSGLEQASNDSDTDHLSEAREVASHCQCLPSCTSIEYEAETSQADYDVHAIFRAFRLNFTEDDKDEERYYSRVMIFFKEAQFITSRRSELYGQTDFLANCGGLLGLFMGFSILSVAEIIYFLTLRLCCMFLRRRNQKILRKSNEKDDTVSHIPAKIKEAYND